VRKITITALALFAFLGTSVARGQTYEKPPQNLFSHIIIIVQENRTPDNLFGSYPGLGSSCGSENDPFETGVDIDNGGPSNLAGRTICSYELVDGTNGLVNSAWNEGGGDHSHGPDWVSQWDDGVMDGACYSGYTYQGNPYTSNPPCNGSEAGPYYPPYSFMKPTLDAPYFTIAENYGFANYMFQTSEGPSFPAHQFLFSGTSAPVFPGDSGYQDFVSENPAHAGNSGCAASDGGYPKWVKPDGTEEADPNSSMCYDRNTLVTYQTGSNVSNANNDVTWNYYAEGAGSIWDAPEANPQTCYGEIAPPLENPACSNYNTQLNEWSNVKFSGMDHLKSAPILTNIESCTLADISWVTPDEKWSDHPDDTHGHVGTADLGLGPDWVADIVNDIGNSYYNSTHRVGGGPVCDYWGNSGDVSAEQPTAIFIVWDDWGGFYDHVPPPAVYTSGTGVCTMNDQPNAWGCGYVFGFRVPLLVVSEYTPQYVSGMVTSLPVMYPPNPLYTHDFGSILAFSEYNFGLPPIAPQVNGYTYADQNSLDATAPGCYIPPNNGCVPLWDFFSLGEEVPPQPRSFYQIPLVNDQDTASFFEDYYHSQSATPTGPDEGTDD
jgi:hypothetical protein